MKINIIAVTLLAILAASCKDGKQVQPAENIIETPKFHNKGHELVYDMVQKVGNYSKLAEKKNVQYTYTYQTPDGKTDISQERYIFDGELSYGKYTTHERTLSQLEGTIEQGYDGKEYWLRHNGNIITEEAALKRVAFNRPTNYYWFTMMQKLLDPGLIYDYLGDKTIDDVKYQVVKVSFTSPDDKPTDIYQLYINSSTQLVDQFLFTVADFGKMEVPNLMQMEYEDVDGILIPTKRKYKQSTWDAEISDKPWVSVMWSDIKFDTGLTKADFKK